MNIRRLATAARMDPATTDDVLAALAVVGFVDPSGPWRWRIHPLLRESAAQDLVVDLLRVLEGQRPVLRQTPPPPPAPTVFAPFPPRLLTRAAAARELGVSVDSLTDWARRGLVPFTWTAGGHRRFDVVAIRALLEDRAA